MINQKLGKITFLFFVHRTYGKLSKTIMKGPLMRYFWITFSNYYIGQVTEVLRYYFVISKLRKFNCIARDLLWNTHPYICAQMSFYHTDIFHCQLHDGSLQMVMSCIPECSPSTTLIYISVYAYWNTVDLQWCISFRCAAKWFYSTHVCMYIYIFFLRLFHFRLLQDIEYSFPCYTLGPCCLSTLYTVVRIC